MLVTITGPDRLGVTSTLFATLAGHDVEVIDVEQVVIRGRLVLGVQLALTGEPTSLRHDLLRVGEVTGLDVDVAVEEDRAVHEVERRGRHHVIMLGRPLRAGAVSEIARRIADLGANIDAIRRLSDYPVTSLELMVSGAKSKVLRAMLSEAAVHAGVDIAVERAGLDRRGKRLIVMDVDSTLVQGEVIDDLAEKAGTAGRVADITRRAMHGELDFAESLRERVSLLEGLPESAVDEVRRALTLTSGARTLIRTLRRMGYRIGIVSGGFTQVIDSLAEELRLDFSAGNTLEIVDGRLTGKLVGPIIDRKGKAKALKRFAEKAGVPLSQTVAVGDGANDLDMLTAAGLGVAFNAKPGVREAADAALNHPYLDAILFFLGISRDEVEAADTDDPSLGGPIRVPL